MNMTDVKKAIVFQASRSALVLKHNAPGLLLTGGLILGGVTVYLAAKATLDVQPIKDEASKRLDEIDMHQETGLRSDGSNYTMEDATSDRTKVIVQTGLKFAKLYAPAVGAGVASITFILSSHGMMKRREAGLLAAYNVVAETLRRYREKVSRDYGEETEKQIFQGMASEETYDVVEEDGEITLRRKDGEIYEGMYARFFDPTNPFWRTDPLYNIQFLRAQQNAANDYLRAHHHMTLNQVYEMLGFEHTTPGFTVGWIYEDKDGDGYISFGIDNLMNITGNVFKYSSGYLLDFNVDGPIDKKI